jgi:hypothetical protein
MNADGSGPTLLTGVAAEAAFGSYSPDGTRVAFTADQSGTFKLFVMDADGSHRARVSSTSRTGVGSGAGSLLEDSPQARARVRIPRPAIPDAHGLSLAGESGVRPCRSMRSSCARNAIGWASEWAGLRSRCIGDSFMGTFVCGFLGCDRRPFNPLLGALPRRMHMGGHSDGWHVSFARQLTEESCLGRAGADCVLAPSSPVKYARGLPSSAFVGCPGG